jgi:PAS domain S-box-containing protein
MSVGRVTDESQGALAILYVEDDPDLRELTAGFLERENDRFEVVSESNASDGLDRIEVEPVDCVISDYDMPGMDGLEFLRTVRETRPDLPFILFTGKGSEAVASEAIAADVTHYLQKRSGPEQYELLANRIENAVSQYHAEQRAAELKRRYEALFDRADDPIAWVEFDCETPVISDVNPAFVDVFSTPTGEFLGADLDQIVAPDSRIDDARLLSHTVRSGEAVHRQVTRETTDGPRAFEVAVIPVSGPGEEEITHAFAVYTDVTEREERERELERIRERMEFALEATDAIVWTWDPEADEATFYPSEEALYGTSVETWADFVGLVHPEDRRTVRNAVERSLETGEPTHEEVRIVRDGEVRWIETSGRVVEDNGRTRLNGVARDVTDRKRTERKLRQGNE